MPWTVTSSDPIPGLLLLSAQTLRRLGLISRIVSKSFQNMTAGGTSSICPSWVPLTQCLVSHASQESLVLAQNDQTLWSLPLATHGCADEIILAFFLFFFFDRSELNMFKRVSSGLSVLIFTCRKC